MNPFRFRPREAAPLLTTQEIQELISLGESWPAMPPPPGRAALPGESPSPRHGHGTEFEVLRPYVPGDDPRTLDWRATARTGRAWVREYREEHQQRLCLLLDRGPSMRFATRGRLKVVQGLRLALLLGARAAAAGASIGGMLIGRRTERIPHGAGQTGLVAWLHAANRPCAPTLSAPGGFAEPLTHITHAMPIPTSVVLISDFADFSESDLPALAALAARCEVRALQVLDPAERELPDIGNAAFVDLAGRQVRFGSDPALRARYAAARADREKAQEALLARAGILLRRVLTTDEATTAFTHG